MIRIMMHTSCGTAQVGTITRDGADLGSLGGQCCCRDEPVVEVSWDKRLGQLEEKAFQNGAHQMNIERPKVHLCRSVKIVKIEIETATKN